MCEDINPKEVVLQYNENGGIILPECANSTKCGGGCKHAAKLMEIANNGADETVPVMTRNLRPTLIINGVEKPFTLNFVQ